MESKQYNLKPYELLNKLYNNNIEGFSEEEISEAEKRLNIKLPKLLREYYLHYGKLSINTCLHRIFSPEELDFSYNYLMEEVEDEDEETTLEDLKKTKNYLLFWIENQGCWYQGIDVEDIKNDNPKVHITTNDDLFEWDICSNSFYSHILSMIYEQLSASDLEYEDVPKEDIRAVLKQNEIDIKKLIPAVNPYDCVHVVTCWDEYKKKLFYFTREKEELESLNIISAED
ncbi:SMI1/KNR4 family protein [Clostridium sp. JS66]|uniref:SMI1/KNR4 family protein n=1 Tax=Clostridium sp. JS66 TaxID=3064705 RepID=UPI00298E3935|nr:SMI1/KNR4 family protein [Clostridium sp. JS66]WPC40100.1 SMI1/KNR4 family protein [Clostridium sp. JS66]